ncbi:MAG TPA: hypothetical protein VFL91_11520 [Thermomicrobiales bacterium]|nr:hypothetical protein [Thermomicrobiales bacterium]
MKDTRLICGSCGAENPIENNYCGSCGAFLGNRAGGDEPDLPYHPSGRPGDPRVRVQSAIILGIFFAFALTCVVLSVVVIRWGP